ncbi:DUF86 domain-containing protein [Pseudalkalibacillus berkeleyi]|uniref:DUF86 domain-containing protein n=1 Tax=Pseudalkalibacillus berkeleyi TaxID=1069813 RepID=A0ABS9H3K4_9BACL|nr:DUF86 domain-containing protein [Pseudalkalibacillus berkeleyi]MCF6138540.1 DUF86 domain-containing protein [Pseudalkalibacillus berkeleyi]
MYFVDRKKIEELLTFINRGIETFETHTFEDNRKDQFALERIAHTIIESVLDVGNKMIDGFIMRDPGSYEDIIEILDDEKVVTKDDASRLKTIIALRKQLVQDYTSIDHARLAEVLQVNIHSLKHFPDQIRSYLTEELGPVSAFLPEDK